MGGAATYCDGDGVERCALCDQPAANVTARPHDVATDWRLAEVIVSMLITVYPCEHARVVGVER